MQSHNPNCNVYSIDMDTPLGQKMTDYIERATNADQLSYDHAMTLIKQIVPADKLDAEPSPYIITLSPDCEAGGLLAISILNEYADSAHRVLDPRIYRSIENPQDEHYSVFYPRMERHHHYMRYKQAVDIYSKSRIDWEFDTANAKERKKGLPLAVSLYGTIRMMSKEDEQALTDSRGRKPAYAARMARGVRYDLTRPDDEACLVPFDDPSFAEAKAVYDAWNSLPSIPFGKLVNMLSLDAPLYITDPASGERRASTRQDFIELSYCYYKVDALHRRYLVMTGLQSRAVGMTLSTDESDYSMFADYLTDPTSPC